MTLLEKPVAPWAPDEPPRKPLFARLGEWCARFGWIVVTAWIIVLVGTTLASSALGGSFNAQFSLPNSPAQIGADLLATHTSSGSSAPVNPNAPSGEIVFHVSNGSLTDSTAAIESSITALRSTATVASVSDPLSVVSPDGRVAVATITYDTSVTALDQSTATSTDQAMTGARSSGVAVDYGGDLATAAQPSTNSTAELIGIGVAVLILLFAFGSVLATLVPVLSAVIGVFAGVATLGIFSAWYQFPNEGPTIALMMGLGIGIDYALFLTTRFRQLILDGLDPREAVGRTVASSGRAIVIAATTVVISLAGLYASGIFYIGQLGISASITVTVAALAAITLVPAMLGIAGKRIDKLKVRRTPIAEPSGESSGWNRYARAIGRHPVVYLTSALLLLLVLAVPTLSLQIGSPGVRALPVTSTERVASETIDRGFGAGYQSPLTVVVNAAGQTDAQLSQTATTLQSALSGTAGVASVTAFAPTPDKALLVGKIIPSTGATDSATSTLITTLNQAVLPTALAGSGAIGYVTGSAASNLALQSAVGASLPIVLLVVVAAAILLILLTFRSPVLALKAGLINLLSIAASYGILVAVFQWGWGSSLLGIPQGIPIVSFVPMLMFAIIFGLSMDYEVFLLSRIRESWLKTGLNSVSIAHGLTVTGRIITCAAVIMACVFFSFVIMPSATIKMLGLGLGISVLIDATIVRLVIVPTAMQLFGKANWWTPKWLDKFLPHLEP
ncbi:hypothetical protein B7R22_17865 [Subtercola boreus]|uniref:SSD domain-containing protein n=1 Tax=Subtercola boreus TaxID=120213 RepID=A0A3E0VQ52_9MICO|nr:MMPL family transporter [Subtercola boreus]RFA11775.1 hypothetical protein B7R22_17865 [Subtercola boreus]